MAERPRQIPKEIQAIRELSQTFKNAFTTPLTPEAIKPDTIRVALALVEIPNPESLTETRMRPGSPRYEAVKEALGSARLSVYEQWTQKVSPDQPQLVNKKAGTKSGTHNRGLMQFCAGLVACGLGQTSPEGFCRSTNARVAKTLNRRSTPPGNLSSYGEFKSTIASVPENSLVQAWQILTSHD